MAVMVATLLEAPGMAEMEVAASLVMAGTEEVEGMEGLAGGHGGHGGDVG